jgi:hypothetical protein
VAYDLPPYVRKKQAKGLTYYYLARGEQHIRLPDIADPLFQQKLNDLYGGTPPTQRRKHIRARSMPAMPCNVYFIGGDEGPIKIGKSRDPHGRCRDMNIGSPQELRVLATVVGDGALEKAYHRRFGFAHMRGEWFERHEIIVAEIARLVAENKDG